MALGEFHFRPIFFLEIGSPSDLDSIEKCEKADLRMRARMAELVGAYRLMSLKLCTYIPTVSRPCAAESPLRTMCGVSTMGPTVCVYKYDKDRLELGITPTLHANQSCGNDRGDTTPRELWNYDLLDEEGVGERKMREVAAEVLDAFAKLHTP